MAVDKGYMSGSTVMLVLSLLNEKSYYGYEIIKTLKERSNNVFDMKEGTLYPILHKLENEGWVKSSNQEVSGRTRKVYSITVKGIKQLEKQTKEWKTFSFAVEQVMSFS